MLQQAVEVFGPWKGDGGRLLPLEAVDWDQIKNSEMVSRPLSLGPRSRKTTGLHTTTLYKCRGKGVDPQREAEEAPDPISSPTDTAANSEKL